MLLPNRVINNIIDSNAMDTKVLLSCADTSLVKTPGCLAWGITDDSLLLQNNGEGLLSVLQLIETITPVNFDLRSTFTAACKKLKACPNLTDSQLERIGLVAFTDYGFMDAFLKTFERKVIPTLAFSAVLVSEDYFFDTSFEYKSRFFQLLGKFIDEQPDEATKLLNIAMESGRLSVITMDFLIKKIDYLKSEPMIVESMRNAFKHFIKQPHLTKDDIKHIINEISHLMKSPVICSPNFDPRLEVRDKDVEDFLIRINDASLFSSYADKYFIGYGKSGQSWPEIYDTIIEKMDCQDSINACHGYLNHIVSAIYTIETSRDQANRFVTSFLNLLERSLIAGKIESGNYSDQNAFKSIGFLMRSKLAKNFERLDEDVKARWDYLYSKSHLNFQGNGPTLLFCLNASAALANLMVDRGSNNPFYSIFIDSPPSLPGQAQPQWVKSVAAEVCLGLGVHWAALQENAKNRTNLTNKIKGLLNSYVSSVYGDKRCPAIELVATAMGTSWLFDDYAVDGQEMPGYLSKRALHLDQLHLDLSLRSDIELFIERSQNLIVKSLYLAQNGHSSGSDTVIAGSHFHIFSDFIIKNTPELSNIDVLGLSCSEVSSRIHSVHGPQPICLSDPLVHKVTKLSEYCLDNENIISTSKKMAP